MNVQRRWLLIAAGSVVLLYSIAILCFILTTPDVGLRVLLTDPDWEIAPGIPIHVTHNMVVEPDQPVPRSGDRLISMGSLPVHTILDFAHQSSWLRNAQGGLLRPGDRPSEMALKYNLPTPLKEPEGERWVDIEIFRPTTSETFHTFLAVQSLPLTEVCLSFAWFLLQLSFFLFGAWLCWSHPLDRIARVTFGLGIVGLGAFIVGNHWWVLAANPWLIWPCLGCAILLPAVLLHFCLVFPRPKLFFQKYRSWTLGAVYSLPCLSVLAALFLVLRASLLHEPGERSDLTSLVHLLAVFRLGMDVYVAVAAAYFCLSLAAIWQSLKQSQMPLKRWIAWSATAAVVLVLFTLSLSFFDPLAFALGGGRLPMFAATILLLVAFSVAIARHDLMQIDRMVDRNMLYYVASLGLTGIISLMIAMSILVPKWFNLLNLTTQQSLTIAAVLTLSVVLLLWLRDLFQQMIERQFMRDHYRLDKALGRIRQSVAKLTDPEAIAHLYLSACRDVMGVERGALYLRLVPDEPYRLMAFAGTGDAPSFLPVNSPFLSNLEEKGSFQRVATGSRSELSRGQAMLWELDVDLVHAFDSNDEITGVVLLGNKPHSASFTSEDLVFLNALGQIANVAISGAQAVAQNISRLNEDLKDKLDKISDQQKQIKALRSQLDLLSEPAKTKTSDPQEFRRNTCIGNSPAMVRVLNTAQKVAASDTSVLIRGESGTGKEVLAQVLHDNSRRSTKPMVRVHCASLSPSLLESELFGHVKGAFTGAHQDREGRFEAANGGTLFLDEIGDISLETQIKLLRVLQERCFEPVGSVKTIHVDVRLVTATHQNLEQLIREGRFREDLFYRLNVICMELPPLRNRREDILELAMHFLRSAAQRMGKSVGLIDSSAVEILENYDWPGNVRELENVMERAVVMADGAILTRHDLPNELLDPKVRRDHRRIEPQQPQGSSPRERPSTTSDGSKSAQSEKSSRENASEQGTRRKSAEAEREELQTALEQSQGNKTQAARLLGMPRSTFFSKLKRHGLA